MSYEKSRNHIVDLLERLFPGGVGVEIGVKRAEFSEHLLDNWTCRTLYLVDPWVQYEEYDESEHTHEANYKDAIERVKRFGPRAKIIRRKSINAAHYFNDCSIDFIYIDGNHSYDSVKQDLEVWYKKLKPGGVFMGDDYNLSSELEKLFGYEFGVRKAVDEFCMNRRISISTEYHGNWFYTNIDKNTNTPNAAGIWCKNFMFFKPLNSYTTRWINNYKLKSNTAALTTNIRRS